MILINSENLNSRSYSKIRSEIYVNIVRSIYSKTNYEEVKHELNKIQNKDYPVTILIKKILFHNFKEDETYEDFNFRSYFQAISFYNNAQKLYKKGNKKARKSFIGDLIGFTQIESNKQIEKFICCIDKISDYEFIDGRIKTQSSFEDFAENEMFISLKKFNRVCKEVFDYETFITPLRASLIDSIGIKFCPYCNEQSMYSEKDGTRVLADLDHYLPKSEFPLFESNFFNLIPSCPSCNRTLKGQSKRRIVNPLIEGFEDYAVFKMVDYPLKLANEHFDITILKKNTENHIIIEKIDNTISLFKLKGRYNQNHIKETARRIYLNTRLLTPNALSHYSESLEIPTLTTKQLYKHLFEIDFEKINLSNEYLGKLKLDILIDLDVELP
ncbi:hypothetical protein [Exiguobacterium sp. s142]|uniref:HNH endonuclease n=1 Tax=Exiguobacterium sp. s142 TaxID=2751222 RepID=UPI001BEC8EAA|nr:hypothetical protein [Exiguobacterium sp. s142]